MGTPESHAAGDGNHIFTLKGRLGPKRFDKIKTAGTLRETEPHRHNLSSDGERVHLPTSAVPPQWSRTIVDLRKLSRVFRKIRQSRRDR